MRQCSHNEKAISQMDGVMLMLNGLCDRSKGVGDLENSDHAADVDWEVVCKGCGMVGDSCGEVDDMVWFVTKDSKTNTECAVVRRRTEQSTWLGSEEEQVNWKHTLFLNIISNWHYEVTVAIVQKGTKMAVDWITKRVFASPTEMIDTGKEIIYEDRYPFIFFAIEDWTESFADLRLTPGFLWAVELSAHSSTGARTQIVRGTLNYEAVARSFQLKAGGALVNHTEQVQVKSTGKQGDGIMSISVSIAPEEEEGLDLDIHRGGSTVVGKLARRARKHLEGRAGKVAGSNVPALKCCLKHIASPQINVVNSISRLEVTKADEKPWIRIPTEEELLRSVKESGSSFFGSTGKGMMLPVGRSLSATGSSENDKSSQSASQDHEDQIQSMLDIAIGEQTVVASEPENPILRSNWRMCFQGHPLSPSSKGQCSLLLVDALVQSTFSSWIAKRGGKRILANQSYHQRMVVITQKGLLHYFSDSTPDSVARGTVYLCGARLKLRKRSRPSATSIPYVLEIHPTTPRRPDDLDADRVFQFGFPTKNARMKFIHIVANFCVLPP
eukprot:TRINITY_DN20922_c0_g1_i1.p1 TRINITY_DN20922_c0_g1~~TRINITY_DN20922_c0_g1_i1.p1  ORF type:complete len:581 (+),score=109.84 TRINITY_DN20922_c0_g1_i1:81-1745(+)